MSYTKNILKIFKIFTAVALISALLVSHLYVFSENETKIVKQNSDVWVVDYNTESWSGAGNTDMNEVNVSSGANTAALYGKKSFKNDFVYELKLSNKFSSAANKSLAVFNYTDYQNYMALILNGDKTIGFLNRCDGKSNEMYFDVPVSTKIKCSLSILYSAEDGRVAAYEITDSGAVILFDYSDKSLSYRSGMVGIMSRYADTAACDMVVYRAFGGIYSCDFEDLSSADDWTLNGYEFGNNENNSVLLRKDSNESSSPAILETCLVCEPYSVSFKINGQGQNGKLFFNYSGNGAYYALDFKNSEDGNKIAVVKGVSSEMLSDYVPLGGEFVELTYNNGLISLSDAEGAALLEVSDTSFGYGRIAAAFDDEASYIDDLRIQDLSDTYKVFKPKFTGEIKGVLSASIDVVNNTHDDRFVSMVVAVYDNEYVMRDYKAVNCAEIKAMSGHNTVGLEFMPKELKNSTDYYAELFVFDGSLNDVKPLTEPIKLLEKHKLIVIGDSITMDYDVYPDKGKTRRGWVQYLCEDLNEDFISVENYAFGAYTTSRYLSGPEAGWAGEKGTWEYIKQQLDEGDYLLIAVGLNDAANFDKQSYQNNLSVFINDAQQLGAEVIMTTPTQNITKGADDSNKYVRTYRNVAAAMLEVGEQYGVSVLELNNRMGDEFDKMLAEGKTVDNIMRTYFDGRCANDPDTESYDKYHFNESGARFVKSLVIDLLRDSSSSLKKVLYK